MSRRHKYIILTLLVCVLSCRKDKLQEPIVEEPTKWDFITGNYKVYDTLGGYLYDMEIEHFLKYDSVSSEVRDFFKFNNFDGQFTFENLQLPVHILSEPHIKIGYQDTLYDEDYNRWKITSGSGLSEEYNYLKNDTIVLKFDKTNINYYLLDLVPYYECECKQVAVKQH